MKRRPPLASVYFGDYPRLDISPGPSLFNDFRAPRNKKRGATEEVEHRSRNENQKKWPESGPTAPGDAPVSLGVITLTERGVYCHNATSACFAPPAADGGTP